MEPFAPSLALSNLLCSNSQRMEPFWHYSAQDVASSPKPLVNSFLYFFPSCLLLILLYALFLFLLPKRPWLWAYLELHSKANILPESKRRLEDLVVGRVLCCVCVQRERDAWLARSLGIPLFSSKCVQQNLTMFGLVVFIMHSRYRWCCDERPSGRGGPVAAFQR